MKILNMRTITGPNVFHYRPVLTMVLALEEYTDIASTDLNGFNQRLVELLPGLKTHHCSLGHEGGFVERLNRGTYFAHIIEHVALELSDLSGIGVTYGKSVYDGQEGRYKIIVRYKCDKTMSYLLESAVDIVRNVALDLPYNISQCILVAKKIIEDNLLGPSTQAIINAANKRNIPWERLNDQNLIQMGLGIHRKFIQATTSSNTSDIAVDIAQNKFLTKKLLERSFVKVPAGEIVKSAQEAIEFLKEAGSPVAIKPLDGNHGRGITLNIQEESEVITAFEMAKMHSNEVLIEECLNGNDYRLLFVDYKLVAAAKRIPAHVIGNGIDSLQILINKENENPLRGESHEKSLTKIVINEESLRVIKKQNLSLDSIIPLQQMIFLKETANLSTGGVAIDVTDEVHFEIKLMCQRAARVSGLDICGIDLIAEDINKSINSQNVGVIEINAGPGLRMHLNPSFGKSRDVGSAIIESMFKDNNGRIPIIAITGTNGKTTVSRLLNHIFTVDGKCVGNTTSDGVYIGNQLIKSGDTTGPLSANAVLYDPSVEVAVLETARGGIIKRGLAFNSCDVAILTNINEDHIGQDGINSIDDVIKIKSLVIEQVKKGGTVILNADCENVVNLSKNERYKARFDFKNKNIIFVSLNENNNSLKEHINSGGHAYFLRDGQIIEAMGEHESVVIAVNDIPLTMKGTAEFHVWNSMAAIAAAHSMKVLDETVATALTSFNQINNPGRTNLYRINNGYLLMDFGHNPHSFHSIGEMVKKWNVKKITGVIAAPGDRGDEMIQMTGLAASYVFDKIIIREDLDKRGRKEGEVSQILHRMISQEKPQLDCKIVLQARGALETALEEMKDEELVIFFYDFLSETEDLLLQLRACPIISPSLYQKKSAITQEDLQSETWLKYS